MSRAAVRASLFTVKHYYQYIRKVLKFVYVRQAGETVLRRKAEVVDPTSIISTDIKKLTQTMVKIMRRNGDLGIAAPQIGRSLRIIALEISNRNLKILRAQDKYIVQPEAVPLQILINPQIKVVNHEMIATYEGCSSIRNCMAKVRRYKSVELQALDTEGRSINYTANGWLARILQHEMDHLDGVLYVDKMISTTFCKI